MRSDSMAQRCGHHQHPNASTPPPVDTREATIWTCPMHPQIRQDHPGACPICGMALEPETATAEAGPSAELVDMTRRFWIGLVPSLPVLVLALGGHLRPAFPALGSPRLSPWPQLAFATPVRLGACWQCSHCGWQ